MKFRKKPVVIEAIRYPLAEYADNPLTFYEEIPSWLTKAIDEGSIYPEFRGEDYWYLVIKTLEGLMIVSPGDFIICGVKGELYPCKPDIFTATYETVENAD